MRSDPQGAAAAPSSGEPASLEELVWKAENVEFTTVGVDVGSSTSHLMFARVHLQRLAQELSSRFVVVSREILWRSPILLTPYLPDDAIDALGLGGFIRAAYHAAGLERSDIDTGAVILTGEAMKRKNARAIAELFAAESGKFVCASAGHHMEALLAAHGSGAVALSRGRHQTILHADIGGGTSKLALVRDGEVLHTAAAAIGGRLVAWADSGDLVRVEEPARQAAAAAGVRLALGQALALGDQRKLVGALADALVSLIRQEPAAGLAQALLVTEELPRHLQPQAISFSGGVSEYIYGREESDYHDIARALAGDVCAALADGRIPWPLLDPGQGIRATVIGASQFTVQVSGNTIHVSNGATLPLRNLPVLYARLDSSGELSPSRVASEIERALRRLEIGEGTDHVALGLRWRGDPAYGRLRALAEGIRQGLARSIQRRIPLVLLLDGDVGKTLGNILKLELNVPSDVVAIDGIQLQEFDYVDIGDVIQPTNVVPVVIKSLLFGR